MENEAIYEPPVLVEIGDFSKLTLQDGSWGWDDYDLCWFLGC
ncbi:lasso RiPP family leader peptide-containing protein [Streptomyces sp. PRKS01-65]|nr:lasso RiPP family leader peptide-containing protein [Streptomyces harenosi]NEY34058.1 lasso RiPP family leader peptide-containing protein [Streptomyces harenosi]